MTWTMVQQPIQWDGNFSNLMTDPVFKTLIFGKWNIDIGLLTLYAQK